MGVQSRQNVESYLRSADYNLLNSEPGFVVADKPGVGGDRDTLLVWLPTELYPSRSFGQLEPSLIDKIEEAIERYPDARYTILVDTLEESAVRFRISQVDMASRFVFLCSSSMPRFARRNPPMLPLP
jgi:hypothetical protein